MKEIIKDLRKAELDTLFVMLTTRNNEVIEKIMDSHNDRYVTSLFQELTILERDEYVVVVLYKDITYIMEHNKYNFIKISTGIPYDIIVTKYKNSDVEPLILDKYLDKYSDKIAFSSNDFIYTSSHKKEKSSLSKNKIMQQEAIKDINNYYDKIDRLTSSETKKPNVTGSIQTNMNTDFSNLYQEVLTYNTDPIVEEDVRPEILQQNHEVTNDRISSLQNSIINELKGKREE